MAQPKLLVFGGSGFVGSRVCEEALKTGLPVVSVNRSGPPKLSADWVSNVEWIQVQHKCCRLLAYTSSNAQPPCELEDQPCPQQMFGHCQGE